MWVVGNHKWSLNDRKLCGVTGTEMGPLGWRMARKFSWSRGGHARTIFSPLSCLSCPEFGTHPDTLALCPLPRIKVKKGLHVTAARPAQPALWSAKLDRFKGSKHHTSLITCHRTGSTGPDTRWAASSPWGQRREGWS